MNTSSLSGARAVAVRIDYHSGVEPFAVETFVLSLGQRDNLNGLVLGLVAESIYSNSRIPDLVALVTLETVAQNDDAAAPGTINPVRPKCPRCGHHDISRDAIARWDIASQSWLLSATYDNQTCENCGAEGSDLAEWVPVEPDA